jgi:hypothetical protein
MKILGKIYVQFHYSNFVPNFMIADKNNLEDNLARPRVRTISEDPLKQFTVLTTCGPVLDLVACLARLENLD